MSMNDMPDIKPACILYRDCLKRLIDLCIAIPMMIVCLIPMLITALVIRLDSPGPAIFRQERLGKDGKVFHMLKFRSMVMGAEHTGTGVYSNSKDERVTRVGRIIRSTSIDELPQLWNIIRGDMSFIGPRPPLTYHPWTIDKYSEEQLHMFDVRPGITGWAQINGRKCVEWNHRIELNVWYVRHATLLLDIRILFMTVVKVLSNADNVNTEATAVSVSEDQEIYSGK